MTGLMADKRRPTLQDIAREAGVSTATVSYVINNGPRDVRPDTKRKVLDVIHRLQYSPSSAARQMKGLPAHAFGVVLPHEVESVIGSPYFGPILDGVLRVARRDHKNAMLFTGATWMDEAFDFSPYVDGRTEGHVVIGASNGLERMLAIHSRGIPLVLINARYPLLSSVDTNNEECLYSLTCHLIELGHKRIAFLAGPPESTTAQERWTGFERAHRQYEILIDEDFVKVGNFHFQTGYERTVSLFLETKDNPPTALVAANDDMAMGAWKAAIEFGLSVPRDLSITGFDNTPQDFDNYPLTTVEQPLVEFGIQGADLLMQIVRERPQQPIEVTVPSRIVTRNSTAPPPKKSGGKTSQ